MVSDFPTVIQLAELRSESSVLLHSPCPQGPQKGLWVTTEQEMGGLFEFLLVRGVKLLV